MGSQPENMLGNNIGAVSALKGYQAQFIYSLNRILFHREDEASFQPEGKFEDLDVYNEKGNVIEIIQVKKLAKTLTLSDIITPNSNSFLRRAIEAHANGFSPKITLASFGPVNDDVKGLSGSEISKELKTRLEKLGLKDEQTEILQTHFIYEIVNEETLTSQILKKIEDLKIYVDTRISLDLLVYWIYNTAISSRMIERQALQAQLIAIGKFQSDRINFHNTFGTLIRPLAQTDDTRDFKKLQADFYQGISATYSHILAGIDISRPEKLELINAKFRESNTVFIHGASGQGKSTLAYRYLHDYCPANAAFILSLPADIATIYEIISSLDAIAAGIQFPVTLYIDVVPGNTDWITVLQELGTKKHLNFLVTIREEDWNSIHIDDKFTYAEVELGLDKSEAELVYEALNKFDIDLQFTDFQNAWDVFGESGPLLEFVYLITQGESLPAKLKSQVDRFVDDSSGLAKDKIKLLRFVVLADCFNARVMYREIAHYLNLDNISRLTELLEREYLLKVSDGRSFITGLHPVRSQLLREFLFDSEIHDDSKFALESLRFIDPTTIVAFLRSAFRHTALDPDQLINKLASVNIGTWIFYNSVLKSLVWKGISDFVDRNRELLHKAFAQFGRGWIAMVNVDISKALEGENFTDIHSLFTEDQRAIADDINSKLTGVADIYKHSITWISTLAKIDVDPVTEEDFQGFAYFVFWLDRLKIDKVAISVSAQSIEDGFKKHTLDVLSRTLYALKTYKGLNVHSSNAQEFFLDRFFSTHNVITLVETEKEIVCKYFFNLLDGQSSKDSGNFIHTRSIQIINQLRFAYPDKETYGTDGYGHKFSFVPDMPDDSRKRIPRRNLPLDYLVEINSIFINLFDYNNRFATWAEYVARVVERRVLQVDILEKSVAAFVLYHKKKNYKPLIEFVQQFWNTLRPSLENMGMPPFPKLILDEWGLSSEGSSESYQLVNGEGKKVEFRKALSLKRYEAYRKYYQEYDGCVTNYLWQSAAQITNEIRKRTKQSVDGLTDYSRSSLVGNLFKAYEIIEEFQFLFRQHFSKFVKPQLLDEIESRENTSISALCFIYRHFIYSTSFLPGNILKIAHSHLNQVYTSFIQKVNTQLKSLGKKLNSSFSLQWDEKRKRVIVFARNDSSLTIYGALEHIYNLFYGVLDRPDGTSVKYAVLSKYYESIFIIPMAGANSVNGKWYEFKLYNLIDKKFHELAQFNLIANDVPEEIRLQYNIQSWNKHLANFGKLDRMLASATTASQLAYHFIQFVEFSDAELDPRGEDILGKYLSEVAKGFQENLQESLDMFNYFIEGCNEGVFTFTSDQEKFEFFEFLLATHRNFFPTDEEAQNSNIERSFNTNEMEQWVPRLEQLSNNIGLIYLVFSDKVIANHRLNNSERT